MIGFPLIVPCIMNSKQGFSFVCLMNWIQGLRGIGSSCMLDSSMHRKLTQSLHGTRLAHRSHCLHRELDPGLACRVLEQVWSASRNTLMSCRSLSRFAGPSAGLPQLLFVARIRLRARVPNSWLPWHGFRPHVGHLHASQIDSGLHALFASKIRFRACAPRV